MKNPTYANRGSAFEEFIRFANDRYATGKIAIIQKQPTEFIPIRDRTGRVCSVKVEEKSSVDFLGRYGRYPIAMEAKHTKSGSIRFDAVQEHQARFLDAFTAEPGTIGLVLLSFNLRRFYAIPWAFWGAAYEIRVRRADKTINWNVHAFGQEWHVPQKFSIRESDLLPDWEVPGNDRKYGLNYLKNAKKYITGREKAL